VGQNAEDTAEDTAEDMREPRLLEMMRACEASSKKTDASEVGRGWRSFSYADAPISAAARSSSWYDALRGNSWSVASLGGVRNCEHNRSSHLPWFDCAKPSRQSVSHGHNSKPSLVRHSANSQIGGFKFLREYAVYRSVLGGLRDAK
jgi:hypothetical protein